MKDKDFKLIWELMPWSTMIEALALTTPRNSFTDN